MRPNAAPRRIGLLAEKVSVIDLFTGVCASTETQADGAYQQLLHPHTSMNVHFKLAITWGQKWGQVRTCPHLVRGCQDAKTEMAREICAGLMSGVSA